MKKLVLSLLVVTAIAALVMPTKKVLISDFTWEIREKTALYAFQILNRSDERLDVTVAIAAESKTESRTGTKLHPLGYSRIEISLAPNEEKKITGELQLLRSSSAITGLSYAAEIKPPNSEGSVAP